MNHPCKHDEKLEVMYDLLQEVRSDVKKLLGYKWFAAGFIVIISYICNLIFK